VTCAPRPVDQMAIGSSHKNRVPLTRRNGVIRSRCVGHSWSLRAQGPTIPAINAAKSDSAAGSIEPSLLPLRLKSLRVAISWSAMQRPGPLLGGPAFRGGRSSIRRSAGKAIHDAGCTATMLYQQGSAPRTTPANGLRSGKSEEASRSAQRDWSDWGSGCQPRITAKALSATEHRSHDRPSLEIFSVSALPAR
jgi:hypothetical protein